MIAQKSFQPAPQKFFISYNTRHKSLKQTVSLEFSGKILRFTLHAVFLTEMSLLPPQYWATRILKHWDHCDTQISIGEGETDTSVSRFLTNIVDWLQFFCNLTSPNNLTCTSGKLKTEFTAWKQNSLTPGYWILLSLHTELAASLWLVT